MSSVIAYPLPAHLLRPPGGITDRWDCTVFRRPAASNAQANDERTVNEFAGRLQDVVDPDAVRADLAYVVHAALEPTHVSVWLSR